ncbi:MarR family winged helix-turn-helix transcriptional regulator [Streptomyces sp. NPDC002676]
MGLASHYYGFVISESVKSESVPSGRSVLLTLQRATHATLHLIATELADLDLTASEINALANLADGQGRTVSQLGAAVGTRPTTLTSVLDRLERRGHITRSTRASDRRSVLIELTESGRAAAVLITQTLADIENRALDGLPAEAVTGFRAVMDALIKEGS